jgi:hypothetical protein
MARAGLHSPGPQRSVRPACFPSHHAYRTADSRLEISNHLASAGLVVSDGTILQRARTQCQQKTPSREKYHRDGMGGRSQSRDAPISWEQAEVKTTRTSGSTSRAASSPDRTKGKTFRAVFELRNTRQKHDLEGRGSPKSYRNPIFLAWEWQQALEHGHSPSRAALARKLDVSRARVTQVLRLLRLDQEVIDAVAALGDPLSSRIVTERRLRPIVDRQPKEQKMQIDALLRTRALPSGDSGGGHAIRQKKVSKQG